MTLGPSTFAAMVWGSVALVGVVLAYQLWALLEDLRAARAEEASR